jgi:hypothetical protein
MRSNQAKLGLVVVHPDSHCSFVSCHSTHSRLCI